jgi:hypothetical protein
MSYLCYAYAHTFYSIQNRYYSFQYNCGKGGKLDCPLPTIPTVSHYEKYGTFIKHHTFCRGIL